MRIRVLQSFVARLSIIATIVWGVLCSSPHIATAEGGSSDTSDIKVIVRTIQALGERNAPGTENGKDEVAIDDCLSDLKAKLRLLPFAKFKLIAREEDKISLKRKDSVRLPNNQVLVFRPMYMENKRVGMWLSWKDADGSDILNTRIHFDEDDSLITGTDLPDNQGRILAIRAVRAQ